MISWLLLERYALGELQGEEKARVDEALRRDAKTRARYDEIRGVRSLRRWLPAAAALAACLAGVFLAVQSQGPYLGVKGDALTLSVESEHGLTTLTPGERYQFRVTCVPPREVTLDVIVQQNERLEHPFSAPIRLQCANDVPLPEALVFDSAAPARVCVTHGARQSCLDL